MSNFKAGDKVHVEFEVAEVEDVILALKRTSHKSGVSIGHSIRADSPSITKHIPAPVVLKAGDVVRFKGGSTFCNVIATHGDLCWLETAPQSGKINTGALTYHKSLLELA